MIHHSQVVCKSTEIFPSFSLRCFFCFEKKGKNKAQKSYWRAKLGRLSASKPNPFVKRNCKRRLTSLGVRGVHDNDDNNNNDDGMTQQIYKPLRLKRFHETLSLLPFWEPKKSCCFSPFLSRGSFSLQTCIGFKWLQKLPSRIHFYDKHDGCIQLHVGKPTRMHAIARNVLAAHFIRLPKMTRINIQFCCWEDRMFLNISLLHLSQSKLLKMPMWGFEDRI